ncbi:hypothetical protein [Lewinella sp. 4G2]|uniref:hypothetical protein n=1 Tax=Lewinella sp. 4G2 TaxID=1803372 RepID=UPI0012F7FC41|nr:hypothetical protein [Lewinella sp. 4G2]
MQPFDHFLVIDWSSRSKPSPAKPAKDAIWVAEGPAEGRTVTKYFRTRAECQTYVRRRLRYLHKKKHRVLVGWDFAFGYPKGFAKALRLGKKAPWPSIWKLLNSLIRDKKDNANNRFTVGGDLNRRITGGSGPFWGVPAGQSGVFLGSKKDFTYPVKNKRVSLKERRLVELRAPKMQPPWKLAYTGSVGGQSLLGIPRLCQLVNDEQLQENTRVWPFQTDFDRDLPAVGPLILHAEIYPSMLSLPKKDKIVDREQVRTYLKWLRSSQQSEKLTGILAAPTDLTEKERKQAVRHEGWVLGVASNQ